MSACSVLTETAKFWNTIGYKGWSCFTRCKLKFFVAATVTGKFRVLTEYQELQGWYKGSKHFHMPMWSIGTTDGNNGIISFYLYFITWDLTSLVGQNTVHS